MSRDTGHPVRYYQITRAADGELQLILSFRDGSTREIVMSEAEAQRFAHDLATGHALSGAVGAAYGPRGAT
jgi:hypothetical protein